MDVWRRSRKHKAIDLVKAYVWTNTIQLVTWIGGLYFTLKEAYMILNSKFRFFWWWVETMMIWMTRHSWFKNPQIWDWIPSNFIDMLIVGSLRGLWKLEPCWRKDTINLREVGKCVLAARHVLMLPWCLLVINLHEAIFGNFLALMSQFWLMNNKVLEARLTHDLEELANHCP